MIDWQRDVRERLEAGEVITGGQIRREQGRKVHIYTFLQRLEEHEGWVFEKKLIDVGLNIPVMHYRLVRKKKRIRPPAGPGPRTNMAERPTEIIIERLLAGEELEGIAVSREFKVSNSIISYVRHRLEEQGYEVVSRRVGYRVFVKVKGLRRTSRRIVDRRTVEFGPFEVKV